MKTISKQNRRAYSARLSKLEPELHTIMKMHYEGKSYREIQFFLKYISDQHIHCCHTTVKKFIDRWKIQHVENLYLIDLMF